MSDQAQLTLKRTTSYADLWRACKVRIDGEVVGLVRARETLTVPISAGRHSLMLRIDWCGSEQIDFEAEHVFFVCGSSLSGLNILLAPFYITLFPRRYLWLHQTA